jgi:hypothetical protein
LNPAYDGFQDEWIKEDIDITAYAGQNFLVRFTFTSDVFDNKDGFYFDDLLIRKVVAPDGISKNAMFDENIVVSPNPSNGIFSLLNPDKKEITVEVVNALGQVVFEKRIIKDSSAPIDLKERSRGMYFIKLGFEGKEVTKKVIVE